jgi:hypothetical protein
MTNYVAYFKEFIYAGCGGNENNFRSKEECEQRCLGLEMGQGANPSAVGEEMFNIRFKLSPPPPSSQKDVRRMERFIYRGPYYRKTRISFFPPLM